MPRPWHSAHFPHPATHQSGQYQKAFDEPTAEDWQERFQKVNAWIRQQPHIDLAAKIPEDRELPTALGIDGIHLNSTGKQLMAQAINEQWASVTGETQ